MRPVPIKYDEPRLFIKDMVSYLKTTEPIFPVNNKIKIKQLNKNGDIVVSVNSSEYKLGTIDLSELSCNSQDRDIKNLRINDASSGSELKVAELGSGPCRESLFFRKPDGEIMWIKRAKYGLISKADKSPLLESNYRFVVCTED